MGSNDVYRKSPLGPLIYKWCRFFWNSILTCRSVYPLFCKGGLGGLFFYLNHHALTQSPAGFGHGLPGAVGVAVQQQEFSATAGVDPVAVKPCGYNPALIEDHDIAGMQVLE